MSRGGTPVFQSQQDLIALIPPDGWWTATWWLGHPEVDLHVNINTPPLDGVTARQWAAARAAGLTTV